MAGGGSLFHVGDNVSLARVLVFLSVLVVLVIIFEQLLHKLEHKTKRYRKYEEMLSKVYRELMILGFIGLDIKILKEVTHINAYSPSIIAFQVADLTIFILALALVFQATCIFVLLRRKNLIVDRAELISTNDLADSITARQQAVGTTARLRWSQFNVRRGGKTHGDISDAAYDDMVQLRVLRHLFLRRFGLPELFPFSKYLRQAQDNQLTHMIDVEMSTWILLIAVAWGLDGATTLLEASHAMSEQRALIAVFVIFSWALTLLHLVVALYFRRCVQKLLLAGGYQPKNGVAECLRAIGRDEASTLNTELAGEAIEAMQAVQEHQEGLRLQRQQQRRRHHLLENDTGFQLIATCVRNIAQLWRTRTPDKSSSAAVASGYSMPITGKSEIRRASCILPVHIRWFSRKAWHFIVVFLLMLNGFYLALLCQCVLYQMSSIASSFGVVFMLSVPLPVLLNIIVFQPRIFRNFMIVSSIFRVDVTTLSEVVNHFSEIVELRSEFVGTLHMCMQDAGISIQEVERLLQIRDPQGSGIIEVETLRLVLQSLGFRLSHFRFNSVAKLLFHLRGTTLEYAQVIRLLRLAQQEQLTTTDEHSYPKHGCHILLRQSVLESGFEESECETPSYIPPIPPLPSCRDLSHLLDQPAVMKAPIGAGSTRRILRRQQSSFLTTSSRALRSLYRIECEDSTIDVEQEPTTPRATVYVRM
ncbi:hypothetical protein Poli38472_010306 [Pythium oligandrum]|uniref:EF-hand domain-containing protein n=1 Tax=Pythium oligandrum TaxID=41045 RepID=A0A8K1FC30_PYTOL|nr:hypothetical protein Poli38472_010306 [Pythium oligandrum]|eukprot:TMW55424.1 hypothetical protein Poli38472_010306 [Pythium oligandrum]